MKSKTQSARNSCMVLKPTDMRKMVSRDLNVQVNITLDFVNGRPSNLEWSDGPMHSPPHHLHIIRPVRGPAKFYALFRNQEGREIVEYLRERRRSQDNLRSFRVLAFCEENISEVITREFSCAWDPTSSVNSGNIKYYGDFDTENGSLPEEPSNLGLSFEKETFFVHSVERPEQIAPAMELLSELLALIPTQATPVRTTSHSTGQKIFEPFVAVDGELKSLPAL